MPTWGVIGLAALPTSPPFLQASYDIDAITPSGGVRYQYTENKVDDFVGYAQRRAIATGESHLCRRSAGRKTDYNNFLFNAGDHGPLTEQQRLAGLTSLQGFGIRTGSTTAPAPISLSAGTIAC